MPSVIKRIAQTYLNKPAEITVAAKTGTADNIRQRYWLVSGMHKLDALTRILEAETFDGMIIFARTKLGTEELADKLAARGFSVAAINGDIQQAQRERTIQQLKDGKIDILVATDVAARGLDVERISHVVNYDVPYDPESYTHRIGQGELEQFLRVIESYEQEHNVPAIEIAAALAKMARGDEPLLLDKNKREVKTDDSWRDEVSSRGSRSERGDRPMRGDRGDRGDRFGERESRGPRREHSPRVAEPGMRTFRIAVGHEHGVKPGNIVGAIANEANIESKFIGRIDIYDDYTTKGKVAIPMQTFRIEVGKQHAVTPGNIVGAIANEAGLDAKLIGHIGLFDDYSTVDLPVGMPKDILNHLKGVWVAGKKLEIKEIGTST
eukprot:gene7694-7523_t